MSGPASPSLGRAALPLGYSMLPRGQIATLVTYLEMSQRPAAREEGASASRSLDMPYELRDLSPRRRGLALVLAPRDER